jgi:hypothetical protein
MGNSKRMTRSDLVGTTGAGTKAGHVPERRYKPDTEKQKTDPATAPAPTTEPAPAVNPVPATSPQPVPAQPVTSVPTSGTSMSLPVGKTKTGPFG